MRHCVCRASRRPLGRRSSDLGHSRCGQATRCKACKRHASGGCLTQCAVGRPRVFDIHAPPRLQRRVCARTRHKAAGVTPASPRRLVRDGPCATLPSWARCQQHACRVAGDGIAPARCCTAGPAAAPPQRGGRCAACPCRCCSGSQPAVCASWCWAGPVPVDQRAWRKGPPARSASAAAVPGQVPGQRRRGACSSLGSGAPTGITPYLGSTCPQRAPSRAPMASLKAHAPEEGLSGHQWARVVAVAGIGTVLEW